MSEWVNGLGRGFMAWLVFGRKARVDCFEMVVDMMEAEFALERALEVTIKAARDQGQGGRAWVLEKWREALPRDRFAEVAGNWVPGPEAMIFAAYGRVEGGVLFAAAARIASLRERQISAVWGALGMPLVLSVGVIVVVWAAGGHFIPVLETVSSPESWGPGASLFRGASTWLYANPGVFAAWIAGGLAVVLVVMVYWTGPGRTMLDGVAPFSLYRMVTGSAFLFVVLEFVGARVDLNERTFALLKSRAGPYARHRITAIERHMGRGVGLGQSMVLAGHGFPDPSLAPVVAALDGVVGWEVKLSRFVERWVGRSDELLRARAAVLNGALLVVVTVVMGTMIDAMFSILKTGGGA